MSDSDKTPVAWRLRVGDNAWRLRVGDDWVYTDEIDEVSNPKEWEPLYSAATVASLERERDALREALRDHCMRRSFTSYWRMTCHQCKRSWGDDSDNPEDHAPGCLAAIDAARLAKEK